MKIFNRKFLFVNIFLLSYIFGYAQISHAFGITPSRAEFVVEPNREYVKEYVISNPEAKRVKIKVFVEKCSAFEKAGDATSWIKVLPQEVTIPPNSSKKIKCAVKIPQGMNGEYTSSLVFRSLSTTKIEMLDVTAQITLMAYVIIKGTENLECEISKVEVLNTEPFKLSVKVKNSGNIHVRPKGKVELIKIMNTETGIVEEQTKSLDLNPIEGPIFPGIDGEIGPKNDEVNLEPGSYKAKVRVELTPEVVLEKETEFTVPLEKK